MLDAEGPGVLGRDGMTMRVILSAAKNPGFLTKLFHRMTSPAPTPQQKVLRRVLIISWFDGWSLVVIAALSLLLTMMFGQLLGTAIGLLVLVAGIMELRGRSALKRRNAGAGMKLLVRSQLFLLTVILVYCARCLGSFDDGYLKEQVIPEMRELLQAMLGINFDDLMQQIGLTVNELVPLAHKAFLILYGTVAVLSLLYQGGLALYYRSRTRPVTEALAEPPPA